MKPILKSTDKLHKPTAFTILGLIISFISGCWGNQWWSARHAEHHYVNQIRELLRESDPNQVSRSYKEASSYYRRSYFTDDFARLHHVLLRADEERCNVTETINRAVISPISPVPPAIQGLTALNLNISYNQAQKYGLYEGLVNRVELFNGNRPTVRKGEFVGRQAEVDHILPSSVFPQLSQLPVNLTWLSEPENIKKGDKVGYDLIKAKDLLKYLLDAEIIHRSTIDENLDEIPNANTAKMWRELVDSL